MGYIKIPEYTQTTIPNIKTNNFCCTTFLLIKGAIFIIDVCAVHYPVKLAALSTGQRSMTKLARILFHRIMTHQRHRFILYKWE